jgi:tetratricopeptide (TPR) repeat protein
MSTLSLAQRLLDHGTARLRAGRHEAALRALRAAVRHDLPAAQLVEARVALAEAHQALGRYLHARRHLQMALAISPRRAALHHRLAMLLEIDETTGDRARAARHYAKAAKLEPKHGGYLRDHGLCLAALGKRGKALRQLRRAHETDPDDLDNLRALALLLAELDREAAARRVLRLAAFRHQNPRNQSSSAYQRVCQLVGFAVLRRRQEAEQRFVRLTLDEPAVILPFSAPARPTPTRRDNGMILRFDGPSTSQPHVPRPARFRQPQTN